MKRESPCFNCGECQQIPIGFGMALAMNQDALNAYSSMTGAEKQAILDKAHHARSEQEMQRIVDSIAK